MRIYITDKDKITTFENNLVDIELANGEKMHAIEPRRLFPVSNPTQFITLLDDEGEEKAVIKNLSDLDPSSRKAVELSLADYYLVPRITKILEVVEKYGTLRWTVDTDRGVKSFDIRNRNHDIKVYPDGRVRVRDSNDNRYTISNWHDLDKHSQMLMIADL